MLPYELAHEADALGVGGDLRAEVRQVVGEVARAAAAGESVGELGGRHQQLGDAGLLRAARAWRWC